MRNNPGYYKMYGNAQASGDAPERRCPGCGKRFHTTYDPILICPLCGYCDYRGARVKSLRGGWLP